MPLQATSGAASYDAFGGGAAAVPQYIEDVFSTWLHTGNGSTQTITNGIDLSTKGGLVWVKRRDSINSNNLTDTARGANYYLLSNATSASANDTTYAVSAFNTNGFSLPTGNLNANGATYASWTFRKQPKFFDVVTYTGTGAATTVAHNLGSVPGCILVKKTSGAENWAVYHRSTTSSTYYLVLNSTAAEVSSASVWNSTDPTSTVFSVGNSSLTNQNGQTYVAYLFAHNAGGFGLTGTDNVISCGSFTTDGSGAATVSLGYEPQWVLVKRTNTVESWQIIDNMRGWPVTPVAGNYAKKLIPNSTAAEADTGEFPLTNTGFNATGIGASNTYIYIAIRRGPMKVPTSGTSVFIPIARTGTGTTATVTTNFSTDLIISHARNAVYSTGVWDRLRGIAPYLETTGTASESTSADSVTALPNTAYVLGADTATDRINRSGDTYANWAFSRAPSFFDIVCYTGTGVARTVTHNLGVAPELMIVKSRSIVSDWRAYSASLGATQNLKPNTTDAATSSTLIWNDTAPTSSVFTVGTASGVNGSGNTYVAYLFATCAGVSKVGSYTGTGALQTVNCGFTSGARFVLIKRTDSTGDWYLYDSARGITSGNDPYVLLNSTAAEVTGTNYVDTDSTGFKVTAAAPAGLNASGGTYIFLAIA